MGEKTNKSIENNLYKYLPEHLQPDFILNAYCAGYFPMWDSASDEIYWHSPEQRAVFDIETIKEPRSLKVYSKKYDFHFTVDTSFIEVMAACSEREDKWISPEMIVAYSHLHQLGYAHSIETRIDGELVGGLYGVSIGGAFFGESMFSLVSQASKYAFFKLADILKKQKFTLLDSQYLNEHTQMLGAYEIEKEMYMQILKKAISQKTFFINH